MLMRVEDDEVEMSESEEVDEYVCFLDGRAVRVDIAAILLCALKANTARCL